MFGYYVFALLFLLRASYSLKLDDDADSAHVVIYLILHPTHEMFPPKK